MPKLQSLVTGLAILLLLGCNGRETAVADGARGPIIIISIDTLRSDRLPVYGYDKVSTPAIDALRKDSILFTRAYSHCPLTLPAHASMLTGLLPSGTGIHDNGGFRLRDGIATVPELLAKDGYATGAAVSSFSLHKGSGIARGFELYDDTFVATAADQTMTDIQRSGEETTAVARDWIAKNAGRDFFFLLHLYEPHTPYAPPEPFRSRYASPYDGEIAHADAITGRFLSWLKEQGIYDRATIILLSDHGEGLGDHGEDEHGILLNREALQIPLVIKLPESKGANTTRDDNVQLIDLAPTILAIAGAEAGSPLPGMNLTKTPDPASAPREIISETYFPSLHLGWSDLHSIIQGDLHLIRGRRAELFNLRTDPAERTDVSRENRRAFTAMSAALEPHREPVSIMDQIPPEDAAKLAALGYLGAAAPSNGEDLPDPRDHIASYREVRHAWGAFDRGLFEEALAVSGRLIERYPRMVDLYQLQADALSALGRYREGAEVAKRGLMVHPGAEVLFLRVADLSFRAGDLEEARRYADLALRSSPGEAHTLFARIALARRDVDAARAEARKAVLASPDRVQPHLVEGQAAAAAGDHAAALDALTRALAAADRRKESARAIQTGRGIALERLGRPGEAEAAFADEARRFPEDPESYRNLIVFLLNHGRANDALPIIRMLLETRTSARSYVVVAEALSAAGNLPAARETLRKGLVRFPDDGTLRAMSRELR